MNVSRTTRLAILGALAGLVTWLISEPFARTAGRDGVTVKGVAFSYGSFYGWFAHMMLGATIVGFIAFSVSLERMRPAKAALWGLAAMALGGLFGWLSDSLSDQLCIRLLKSGQPAGPGSTLFWHFAVAMSLALALAICTQPTVERVLRTLAGGLGAALGSYIARMSLAPLTIIIALARGVHGSVWHPYEPDRLFDHVIMGLILGLSVGLGETFLTQARLRLVLGRNEGRDFTLGSRLNRLGSAEGIEVSLFGDPAVAPLHAQIWQQDGRWLIQDAGTPAGTFVNGHRITQAFLQGGETIQIGSSSLVFSLRGQMQTTPVYVAPVPVPIQTPPAAEKLPEPQHRLIDGFGTIYDLKPGPNEIGRDSGLPISLPHDNLVSRRHASVKVDGGQAVIEDLRSRNGTSINGSRITQPQELIEGDVIELGSTRLTYRKS